jgi:hypothetical protein
MQPAPETDEVIATTQDLLAGVRAATRAALDTVAYPGEPSQRESVKDAQSWIVRTGPAIASAIPQSLVHYGTFFRLATDPAKIRKARHAATAGNSEANRRVYLLAVTAKLATRAASECSKVGRLWADYHEHSDAFRATAGHSEIEKGLAFFSNMWRAVETRTQSVSARLSGFASGTGSDPASKAMADTVPEAYSDVSQIAGLTEFELARSRKAWQILCGLAAACVQRRDP